MIYDIIIWLAVKSDKKIKIKYKFYKYLEFYKYAKLSN
jgi:hypothetical protein